MNGYTRGELQCAVYLTAGATLNAKTLALASKYHFDGFAGIFGEAIPAAARSVEHAYRMIEPDIDPNGSWFWFFDVVEPIGTWLAMEWSMGHTPGHDELIEQVFVRVNALERAA